MVHGQQIDGIPALDMSELQKSLQISNSLSLESRFTRAGYLPLYSNSSSSISVLLTKLGLTLGVDKPDKDESDDDDDGLSNLSR